MPTKRPTIGHVATRARVSRTTVSRVLNGRGELSPPTVQHVLSAIEKLGYRPSEVARSLSCQRTHTVGMIVYDILNPDMAKSVFSTQVELAQRGFQLILTCMSGHVEAGRECFTLLEDRRVDGVITNALLDMGGRSHHRPLPDFGDQGSTHSYDPATGRVLRVKFDEVGGGAQDARHLLGLGHEKAVVGYNDEVFAHYSVPRLTSVRAECNTIGTIAAQLMLELLDHEEAPAREVVIPTEVVVRESTGYQGGRIG